MSKCQLLPSRIMLGGRGGGWGAVQWLCIVVLHSFFGCDHEFCCPKAYCNGPYLWFHTCQKQKRLVFVTYLQTLCFLFPFQCTDGHLAQLCVRCRCCWWWCLSKCLSLSSCLLSMVLVCICKHMASLVYWTKWDSRRENRSTTRRRPFIHRIMKTIW